MRLRKLIGLGRARGARIAWLACFSVLAIQSTSATLNTSNPAVELGDGPNIKSIGLLGHQSFGTIKQIDAGLLNVGYAEAGPPDGQAVILLHGWPYDIYSYVEVAPALAEAGYRVIVPYLRGYG